MKIYLLTALLALTSLAAAQDTTPAPTDTAPAQIAPADTAPADAAPTDTAPADAMPAEPDPTTVIATVNGTDYTLADFDQAFRLAVARSANAQGMPYSSDLEGSFESFKQQFLDTFVRQQEVLQLAKASGAEVDTAAVDSQLADSKGQFATGEEFVTALNGSGFADEAEYRSSLEDQSLVNAYLDKVRSRFTFSDNIIAAFYNLNKASFTGKASACVKHILVPTEAEAQQIVKDLAAGGDFAAIAQAKSQDPGSAVKGGDLGCLSPGDTVPEFDKASFSGPLNQVQVVKTQFGYHVLEVTKRTEAGLAPLADVQGQIRDQLANQAAQKYLDARVARLPKTLYPDRLPAAPASDSAPTDPNAPADSAPADAAPTDTAPTAP